MALDFFNDPVAMYRAGNTLDVSGQLIGAFGHMNFARQIQQAGAYESGQLRQNAGQAQAAAQHDAEDMDRRTQLVASRALAVAAASGGGASDPGVVNTIASIASEGAYRKALAIYQGEDTARLMSNKADALQASTSVRAASERNTALGGFLGASTSLVKGNAQQYSLREKYGGNGPKKGILSDSGKAESGIYGLD